MYQFVSCTENQHAIINVILGSTRLQTTARSHDWLEAVTLWCIPFDFNNLVNFLEQSVSAIMVKYLFDPSMIEASLYAIAYEKKYPLAEICYWSPFNQPLNRFFAALINSLEIADIAIYIYCRVLSEIR